MTPADAFAPAAERNAWPILGVIAHELAEKRSVLEIGSGTAQHAVLFGREMPWLDWQTSDLAQNHPGIEARLADAGLANVRSPILLDVCTARPNNAHYDAVYSSNTAHIMGMNAVTAMFDVVGRFLDSGGAFLLYGPFRIRGDYTTESNAAFDRSLRSKNADMGLRDVEEVDSLAKARRLRRKRLYAMPSNNFMIVWEKAGGNT